MGSQTNWIYQYYDDRGFKERNTRTYPLKFPRDFVLKSATVGTDLIGNTFNCFSTLKNWMGSCQSDDTYSTRKKNWSPIIIWYIFSSYNTVFLLAQHSWTDICVVNLSFPPSFLWLLLELHWRRECSDKNGENGTEFPSLQREDYQGCLDSPKVEEREVGLPVCIGYHLGLYPRPLQGLRQFRG